MATKAIGILNLHDSSSIGSLTLTRSLASTSFLGRYAFMDFMLSNFSNSGMDEKALLVKEHLRSIVQHMGKGQAWSDNTKLGGLTMLYDEPFASKEGYNHDINNLWENKWYLKGAIGDVVVIAPAHILYHIDFAPLIEDHVKNNHRISVIVQKISHAKDSFIGEDIASVDEKGFLRDLNPNQGTEDSALISLQTYIIDKEVLNGMLNIGRKTSSFYSLRDTIKMLAHDMPVYTYEHKGYARCFDSLEHYLEYSLELLNSKTFGELFHNEWDIYTKTYDTPPAKYGESADVRGSFIANGCEVEGTVINSILARDVIVKKGAVIKNSVILSGSFISEGTHIENVVVDKEAKVLHAKEIVGKPDHVEFINRGDIV